MTDPIHILKEHATTCSPCREAPRYRDMCPDGKRLYDTSIENAFRRAQQQAT